VPERKAAQQLVVRVVGERGQAVVQPGLEVGQVRVDRG